MKNNNTIILDISNISLYDNDNNNNNNNNNNNTHKLYKNLNQDFFNTILSEPSDSEDSDNVIIYDNNINKINYKKLTYNDVKNQINKYYKLDFSQRYSSALDILASYLKGQKIIYMEASNYTITRLYLLMIPAIAISSFCSVAQSPLECQYIYGSNIIAELNG